jgi:hypothetical protein
VQFKADLKGPAEVRVCADAADLIEKLSALIDGLTLPNKLT